jgi:2-polyprenyl-3-methyl-5-hydroxy-6-metoxy-1,4-benzoquinol methylase
MGLNKSDLKDGRLRLLVAIASYGNANLQFLNHIIKKYRSMAMDVDVVVLSEAKKILDAEVELVVGLPSKNPWSLPFAHKTVFAKHVDQYDLFVYSEDDIEVTQQNIEAFLSLQNCLQPDEIAGFLRYEIDQHQVRHLPDVHEAFHWRPESVRQRAAHMIAEYTNEHAGFYMLTQCQLRRAIASGGFLRDPHEGRYGLPETAATDPYTNCGFRKVVSISHLDQFLIHHMSNRYVGQVGLSLDSFKEQIQTLIKISRGDCPASTLCEVESKFFHCKWSKNYYEKASDDVLSLVPESAKTILSVGCGWGATEAMLKHRGADVTALPLDSVIGEVASGLGINVINGTMTECLAKLDGSRFDCVLISNLLHLQPDPGQLLEHCANFVAVGGAMIIVGPNFNRLPVLYKCALGRGDYRKLRSFDQNGISPCGPGSLAKNIRHAGLELEILKWRHEPDARTGWLAYKKQFGRFFAEDWIIRATR